MVGAASTTLPSGDVLVVGAAATLLVAPDGTARPGPTLGAARRQAAATVIGQTVLIAGGFNEDGAARADAERLDATSLTGATIPLVQARGGATAATLPNQTVLLIGGRDRDGGAGGRRRDLHPLMGRVTRPQSEK